MLRGREQFFSSVFQSISAKLCLHGVPIYVYISPMQNPFLALFHSSKSPHTIISISDFPSFLSSFLPPFLSLYPPPPPPLVHSSKILTQSFPIPLFLPSFLSLRLPPPSFPLSLLLSLSLSLPLYPSLPLPPSLPPTLALRCSNSSCSMYLCMYEERQR